MAFSSLRVLFTSDSSSSDWTYGLWMGGGDSDSTAIEKTNLASGSSGGVVSWGSLNTGRSRAAACSNGTNSTALIMGGYSSSAAIATVDYKNITSDANSASWGALSEEIMYGAGTSNGTSNIGILFGGMDGTSSVGTWEKLAISASGSNSASAGGDLVSSYSVYAGGCASDSTFNRGLIGGGNNGSIVSIIQKITISSTGTATNHGNLSVATETMGSCDNAENGRAVWGGGKRGSSATNAIDYVSITSGGTASDFGDLTDDRRALAGCSSGQLERGCFGGGYDGSQKNVIDSITISSTGNSTDFGDLSSTAHYYLMSTSGA